MGDIMAGTRASASKRQVCKKCKNEIPFGSIFCNYCGERQVKERKKKDEIKIPKARELKSGSWNIQLREENVSITEPTEALCEAKAKAIRAGLMATKKKAENITLSAAIDKYISEHKNRLKDRSIEQYEYIRDHRFEVLMSQNLSDITSEKLGLALDAELAKPSRKGGTISPKTANDALNLVLTVIRAYYSDAQIKVTQAEVQRSFPVILTPEEIYPAIKGTDVELPCLLAMWLSLSMSEIRGLTKSKSIRSNKLYIVETVVDVKGKPVRRTGGKEENRPRVFDIPPYIKSLIDAVDGDIIEPRSGHAVYMRFQKVLENAGLPKMKFHALRHVNASVMADKGIPTNVAQERGGWKTDDTMKKVYTHTFDPSRKAADQIIDSYFETLINSKITNKITNEQKIP
jgi:integrase